MHTFNGTPAPVCCPVCKNDSICIAINGVDLPVGGTIDFYASQTQGFNPYVDQSNPLGTVLIQSPLGGPILPPNNPQVNFPNTTLIGAMINACGLEGENEFVFLNSGATGTNVANFQVIYNSSNTVRGCPPLPGNTVDIYTTANATTNPGLIAGLNANAGCVLFQAAPAVIPPNSIFAVFSNSLNPANYDFTAYCGITIYVLFGTGWSAAGNFANANGATRDFCVDDGTGTDVYTYTNPSATIDGTYATWDMPSAVNSEVPAAPDCGVGQVFPEIADPLVFCFTFGNSFCNSGPVYVSGIINPHPDENNPTTNQGTTCEITNTNSTTDEFSFCVSCLTPIFTVSPVNCVGGSDGSVTVTPTGGTPPYTYQWAPGGATTPTITGLTAGTYTVTITDDSGCAEIATIVVNQINPLITGIFISGNVSCFGASDGFINAQAQGGTSPYTYLWNTGAITSAINNLPPGTYTLTVTDGAGCTATTSATLTQPSELTVSTNANGAANCADSSDGSATATGSGGTPPYGYTWDNGETTQTATGLTQGTNTVTVTDDSGCTATASVSITAPSQLTVALGNGGAVCFGGTDGFITATPNGGTPGYTYVWSTVPAQTTQTATGLSPGNYGVTVTDANGCLVSASADVVEAPDVVVTTTQVNLACNGASNGSITASAMVGFPFVTYQFVWSNGTTANGVNVSTINNLPAGTYSVTVTDAILGVCSKIVTVTITEPPAFDATISSTNVNCGGASDGSATVTATGGTPPYSYQWNPGGATTPTISNLGGGTYIVTVTDNNGCTTTASTILTEPQALFTLMSSTTPISCNGVSDGVVTVQANGGLPPYMYQWNGGQTTPSISNLGPGTYTVTVTDDAGCTDTNSISINEPLPFTVLVVDSTNTSCSACIGTVDINVLGGVSPFTYQWSGGQTIQDPTTLCAGTNVVTVTDANGCTALADVIIGSTSTLAISTLTIDNPVSCNSVCDGVITVTGTGGQPPYGYQWNTGATTPTISGLCAGSYTITLTDVNGCLITDVLTIGEPSVLTVNAQPNSQATCGASDGSATATATGGTVPYTYQWDSGQNGSTATNLTGGVHTVTVTDTNGCTATTDVTIGISGSNLVLAIMDSTITGCSACIGSADLTVSNGTPPFSYQWSGGQTVQDPATLCAGLNIVTVTDANGCTATEDVFIINDFVAVVIDSFPTTCNACVGDVDIHVDGGVLPLTYQWSGGQTSMPWNLCEGLNSVTITDALGCVVTTQVIILSNSDLEIDTIVVDSEISCNGSCDGEATVIATNGQPPYTYQWSNGTTSNIATGLCAGTYTVTVSDVTGCALTSSINVTEPALLTASAQANSTANCGASDGSATASATGGTTPYSYQWDSGHNGPTATNLSAGTHTVTVTDDNGCVATTSVVIGGGANIIATIIDSTNTSCTACIGTADLSVTSGTPPFTYIWSGGQTVEDPTTLCAGTNTVTVTDANGCTATADVIIGSTNSLVINTISVDSQISCFGICDGVATVTATGGQPPYSYQWGNGASTSTVTGLCAGSYSPTVTDANGCIAVDLIVVNQPDTLIASAQALIPSSCGLFNGSAVVTATGGTTPYTYLWDSGETTATATALGGGQHVVVVTDVNGCNTTAGVIIGGVGIPLSIAIVDSTSTSCTACIGTADLQISGGGTPFTIIWSGGQTVEDPTTLCAGNNVVTVTDANGCVETASVNIGSTSDLIIDTLAVDVPISCNGICDGEASVSATGGQQPYGYQWSNGATTNVITGLCPGSYGVTISDVNGCLFTDVLAVTEPTPLNVNAQSNGNASCTASDGSATATANGGTTPYSYQWDSGHNGPIATNLSAGTHTVTVTDTNGCLETASVTIGINNPLFIDTLEVHLPISCSGACDGEASVSPTGGPPPYSFQWSHGPTTHIITGLCAGSYGVTVYDANGCEFSDILLVNEPSPLNANALSNGTASCIASNGSATATATGGTTPYTYQWDSGHNGSTATNLSAGTHTVTVTDNNGCLTTASVVIGASGSTIIATVVDSTATTCSLCIGTADLSISGGTPPFTYIWSGGQTIEDPTTLCAGNNQVTITDANGCLATTAVSIGSNNPLFIDTLEVHVPISCSGACDGEASVSPTGGPPPYSFQWSHGPTTHIITGLCAGSYGVTVYDANGCEFSDILLVNEPSPLSVSTQSNGAASCAASDGSATATATGGTTPYTYTWDSGHNGPTATNLSAGTHIVTVTDNSGCTATSSVVIADDGSSVTAVMIDSTSTSCTACIGTADLNVTSGTAPFTYSWSGGQTVEDPTTLCAGNNVVTITDANGCVTTASVTIGSSSNLTIDMLTLDVPISCNGICDGEASVSATGGQQPYGYQWSNGATTNVITGLCAGNYGVTISDANGCLFTDVLMVNEPMPLSANAQSNGAASCNASDGIATVTATGGTIPYTYNWDSGHNGPTATNLSPGTPTVTVVDNNGCSATSSVVIGGGVSTITAAVVDSTTTSCTACIGTADLSVSGGIAPLTYSWSGGQTVEDPTTLCAGNNMVTITDANGCTATATVNIGSTSTLAINTLTLDNAISCNGVCDGVATVTGTGGQTPYGYQWSNGATTSTITGLCAGSYGITLTDVNGCLITDVLMVNEPTPISLNTQTNGIATCGASDGSATATATGGTFPYTYTWDSGHNGPTATNLTAGTHIVTVTDNNGCTATSSVVIVGGVCCTVAGAVITNTSTSCTACIGTADLNVTGGTPPFTYIWSGGQTIEDPTTLCAGNNTVTITDANGCTATASVSITSTSTLAINTLTIDNPISCNGVCDGEATVTGTGGQTPYGYQWSNGATTATITGLCAGNYGITLTDNNGCLFTDVLIINEPTPLNANAQSNGAATCGIADGSATVSATGGTMPYAYNWDNTETTATATGLSAGAHAVTVTDNNGCATTAGVFIPLGGSNIVGTVIDSTNTSCTACIGTADLTVTGGTAPFTYNWSGGQTIEDPTTLCAGLNSVTITDANGCTGTASVTIGSSSTLTISTLTIDNQISCFGACDGTATATATGGVSPYTYQWNSGLTTSTITGLCAGTYTVTIDDSSGCTTTGSITLNQPDAILANATVTGTISCNGGTDGSAVVSVTGGSAPYQYIWTNGSTITTATGLGSGIHVVTVTDNNNCQVTTSIIINPVSPVIVASQSVTNANCNGSCDGTATVSGTGGTSPYSYQWDAAAGNQTTATATGLCAGTYSVTISDSNGCAVTSSAVISEPSLLSIAVFNSTNVTCFGQNDGTASVATTGGNPPYTINWSNAQTGPTANNLPAGGYTATVTDASGCTATTSVTITQPAVFTALAVGGALNCFGDTNGSITLTLNGGTAPFIYNWTGGAAPVQNPGNLGAGTYNVTVVDTNGCTATASATLTSPTQISATNSSTAVLCGGSCDGSASVVVTGGSGVYTYQWSASAGGQTTATAINLCSGTHAVTITDASGCSIVELVNVGQPAIFSATTSSLSDASCFGALDGSATVNPQGGTTPYLYQWDNNETTATATGLNGGVHTVVVTDANGCTVTASVVINQPSQLSMQITSTNITCNGASDGQATATTFGGTGAYTYNWSTGASGPVAVLLPLGTHYVTVTDGNGCSAIDSVSISEPPPITATVTSQDASCYGSIDGNATVVPIGGVAPFTYLWDNGEVTNPAIQLPAGPHIVVITDANGCTTTAQATIGSPTELTVGAVTSTPTCNGFNDGTATATATGGTAPYIYTWSTTPPQIGQVATGLTGGVIVLSVVDANGCQITNVNVTVDDAPDAIGLTMVGLDASCNNGNDGSLTVTATGGTPSYTYQWSNGTSGPTAFGLPAGGYAVTVTDANGCSEVAIGTIDHPTAIQAPIQTIDAICFGEQNGSIVVIDTLITGGVGPYSYSIDGLNYQLGNVFGGLNAGSYTFYVQDANGCVYTESAYVAEPAEVEVDLGPDIEILLGDSVTIIPQTAPPGIGLTYQWTPPEYLNCTECPTVVSTPLETITYELMVTDTSAGCTAMDDIQITVDKSRDVFIPNVFTPNGDNINDLFMIYGGPAATVVRTFNVYDRWGELLFTAENFAPNDPTNGWDGRFKNQRMNGAVFVYYAEVEFIDGEVIEYKGDVTLVR